MRASRYVQHVQALKELAAANATWAVDADGTSSTAARAPVPRVRPPHADVTLRRAGGSKLSVGMTVKGDGGWQW